MLFKTYIPSFPLSEFVSSFIYYEGFNPGHTIDRFLPDGNTELIIELTGQPNYIYDNDTLREKQACKNAWVSGVRTGFISIPSGRESKMFIVNFRKGRAYPFYTFPMNELSDHVVDADLVWGSAVMHLREQLLEAPCIDAMFPLVEKFLLALAGGRLNTDIPARCIHYAMEHIVKHPHISSLKEISNAVGYSHKHLIDLFKKHVGVAPKTYLKIIRFQKAIAEIENGKHIQWSSIAAESGYFDQSHFIHDFRRFSGFTPGVYAEMKNGQLNYVPVA